MWYPKSPSWGIPYSRYAGFVWCNGSKVLCGVGNYCNSELLFSG
jgi:hypothetical protein